MLQGIKNPATISGKLAFKRRGPCFLRVPNHLFWPFISLFQL